MADKAVRKEHGYLSIPELEELDRRVKQLRDETFEDLKEFADDKPVLALLRAYSKMKMFCEFYDSLRGDVEP